MQVFMFLGWVGGWACGGNCYCSLVCKPCHQARNFPPKSLALNCASRLLFEFIHSKASRICAQQPFSDENRFGCNFKLP